jgi:hypothetical protein
MLPARVHAAVQRDVPPSRPPFLRADQQIIAAVPSAQLDEPLTSEAPGVRGEGDLLQQMMAASPTAYRMGRPQ